MRAVPRPRRRAFLASVAKSAEQQRIQISPATVPCDRFGVPRRTALLRESPAVTLVEGQTVRGTLPNLVEDVTYVGCVFDNCHQRSGVMRNVEFIDCAVWATSFREVVFEDCLMQNLKTRIPGQSPGKSMPLFFWGCFARHLTIRGTVGGFMWNPPTTPAQVEWSRGKPRVISTGQVDFGRRVVSRAERFYQKVDWAVDISEARFRSVPTFSFGPPGELFVRDKVRQPMVTREAAKSVEDWQALRGEVGIWWVTLQDFQARPWPETKVLVPALGGRKAKVDEELAGINYLREAGLTLD